MPAPFETLMTCSLGGGEFQCDDYSIVNEPSFNEEDVEEGRSISIDGTGWIEASSAGDLATRLAAVDAAFEVKGQDFRVKGMGGVVEFELLAASCINGGPHVTFERLAQQPAGALRKAFRFRVRGQRASASSDPLGTNAQKVTTDKRPDALAGITIEGEVRSSNAMATYEATVLAQVRISYPWPHWVVKDQVVTSGTDSRVSYTIAVEQLATPLPDIPNAKAVDGTASVRTERDEQMNQLITYTWDLMIIGDPLQAIAFLRNMVQGAEGVPLRETVERTFLRELRVRASFTILKSASGNRLLDFEQQIEFGKESEVGRVVNFDNVANLIVFNAAPVFTIMQTGRAVGLGVAPKEADALAPDDYIAADPGQVVVRQLDSFRFETSWRYVHIGTRVIGESERGTIIQRSKRPIAVGVY